MAILHRVDVPPSGVPDSSDFGRTDAVAKSLGPVDLGPELPDILLRLFEWRARRLDDDPAGSAAWDGCYPLLAAWIEQTVDRRSRNGVDREDAIQEAWLILISRISRYRSDVEGQGLLAWWAVAIGHRLANLARQTTRRREVLLAEEAADALVGREDDPVDALERTHQRAEVRAAIAAAADRLSMINHQILVLRWLEDVSHSQISEALGLTAAQVSDHHRRAFPVLCALLGQRFAGERTGASPPLVADPRVPELEEVNR